MPKARYACEICGYSYGDTEKKSLKIAKECEAKGLTEKPCCEIGDYVQINTSGSRQTVYIKDIYPATMTHKLCYLYKDNALGNVFIHRESIIGKVYVVPV